MVNKTFIPEGEAVPASQIGATLEALAATIAARRDADEASYTYRLLTGSVDDVLKKVMEESGEVALAAKDVEGWATSSLAAAVALEAASAGAGDAVSDAEAADEGAGAPLSVQLPPEYGEAVDHLRYEAADVVYHLLVVLERYGINVDYLPSGIDTVSLVVSAQKVTPCLYPMLGDLQKELKPDSIHVTDNMAIVAAVGRKMAYKPGTSGRIFAKLGENGINIRMITQGPEELNIIVGVDGGDFERAIRVLYDSFVK